MKKRGLVLATMVACLSLVSMFTSLAGEWKQLEGGEYWQRQYINDDGTFKINAWQQIEGNWYHFDENGYLDVNKWITEEEIKTQYIEGVGNYTYTDSNTYWVDDTGVMATTGSWEGAIINTDGSLYFDEVMTDEDGSLHYYGKRLNASGNYDAITYKGTIAWKAELLNKLVDNFKNNNNSFTLDYQLPADWRIACPNVLLDVGISFTVHLNAPTDEWSYSYNVDKNTNILHLTVTY